MRKIDGDGPHQEGHRQGLPRQIVIPSDPAYARRVQDEIEFELKKMRYDDREVFGVRLALEEALVNAIKHGNKMDPTKQVFIHYQVDAQRCEIGITDEGRGFDPGQVADCLAPENLERPGGRGLFLMRHYMTEVEYHPPGNHLTMCKVRNGRPVNGHNASRG